MEFAATENQQMIAQTVKDFTEKHIRPNVMTWDEAQEFPLDVFKKMGDIGLMGILVPEQYQGAGLGYFEYVNAIVEVARVCGSVGLSMAAHNSLCTGHILAFGNEEQKKKWLPKLATGQWIGAWGLTEANTGSDAMRMQCVAKQDGDSWIINGAKNWITHGKSGDVAVVLARTGELLDSNGITAFVVERGTPGFKAGKKENKLGMRCSETAEMIFEDCRVPASNILGKVGDGFKQAMKILDGGRIS
ncbi:MAG TPA: acyl-CoA dehydrogenase family protein, partial [Bacteroidia bacterium]|nr:acyl-CoA dehydrogenase family protein [Bacteroidia bacterium]